jgi:general stress protein CsbA
MMSLRNPHIALVVTAVILFGGGLILRHAGGTAIQVVTVVAVAAGFVVLHALEARDHRRQRSH